MSNGNGTTTHLYGVTSTTSVPTTAASQQEFPSNERILVGCALAISGNLLISISMNIQKYSHNQLKGERENSYLSSATWWVGIVLMVLGEIGNFSAYAFAPASLVAPLGTTTVIANAIIAVVFLKEKIRARDVLGIVLAIVGAFLLINFSNKTDTMLAAHEIIASLKHLAFVIYLIIEIIIFALVMYAHQTYDYAKVVTILIQVAILGSLTVISAKAVSSMLTLTFRGNNQLGHPIFYLMLFIMVVTAVGQVKFLNEAMASYDTTVVVPTNFVFFTMSAILSGIIFYREFYGLMFLEIFMFLFGAFLSFGGVYLITAGRKENDEDEREAEEAQSLLPNVPIPIPTRPSGTLERVQPENGTSNVSLQIFSETSANEQLIV